MGEDFLAPSLDIAILWLLREGNLPRSEGPGNQKHNSGSAYSQHFARHTQVRTQPIFAPRLHPKHVTSCHSPSTLQLHHEMQRRPWGLRYDQHFSLNLKGMTGVMPEN
jgi:hypothetical protein